MPRIAVVSDLHCHMNGASSPACSYIISDAPRIDSRRHPVEALAELVKNEPYFNGIDLLLCPGDLANQIDPQGIYSGWQTLQEIGYILGAPPLIATLGNHDIDSHEKHDCARSDPLFFGKSLGSRFPSNDRDANSRYWSEGFHSHLFEDLFILNVNSTHGFNKQPRCKRGGVTDLQRQGIERHLEQNLQEMNNRAKVLLCHHHPIAHEELNAGNEDLMDQGSLLIDILAKYNFNLVVHGHKHHPRLKETSSSYGRITVLAAGSFSSILTGELAQFSQNLFHVIDIDKTGKGEIKSWKFRLTEGWTPADWSSSNIPSISGFGFQGDISVLVDQIDKWLTERNPLQSDWAAVAKKFPMINNLLPGALIKLSEGLMSRHISTMPSPPDRPQLIGKLHYPTSP